MSETTFVRVKKRVRRRFHLGGWLQKALKIVSTVRELML